MVLGVNKGEIFFEKKISEELDNMDKYNLSAFNI